ncbi:MAG: aminotransferase class I/II-fold pyridoxal phosphate-dependent enzyme [Xanthomonadales bacterium]|nr:aminotransferase class I/II-fold pyridoxal phosphate-dependent enzyme [Xanthomonadales bacterium]
MTVGFDSITAEVLQTGNRKKWAVPPGHIGATVAEMDFGTAPPVRTALRDAVDRNHFGYSTADLFTEASRACSTWLRSAYGWNVADGSIRMVPDVLGGFMQVVEHYSKPGAQVILPTPGHKPFFKLPLSLGRRVVAVPMLADGEGWKMDLEAIASCLEGEGGIVILCNPHNPIGKVYLKDELVALSKVVEKHHARVLSDEVHAPLVFSGHRHVPYASISDITAGHTVTITSAGKAWNISGLKCAQIIFSNKKDLDLWDSVCFMPEHNVGRLGLVATRAAYLEGGPWLGEVIAYCDANRKLLTSLLRGHAPCVGYREPQGTYLAWLDFRTSGLGDAPAKFLAEQAHVACEEGSQFGPEGTGFVRLNLAMPSALLVEAMTRIGRVLAKPRNHTA